jgi:[ribosomal protein S18]-alanine N-acetyltransferase
MSAQISNRSPYVRRFKPVDILAIEKILAHSPEAAGWSTKSLEQLENNERLAWVIESNGAIIGFLATRIVATDEAEILNLAVAQSHRRTGAATALLHAAIAELCRAQIRQLHLEVRESNLAAISLYEKNSFTRSGRRPNYYRHPDEAAVLLVRELTG